MVSEPFERVAQGMPGHAPELRSPGSQERGGALQELSAISSHGDGNDGGEILVATIATHVIHVYENSQI